MPTAEPARHVDPLRGLRHLAPPVNGQDWLTAKDLFRLHWQEAAVGALIPEGLSRAGEVQYHRAQIIGVLTSPFFRDRVADPESAAHFRDQVTRNRISKLQQRSREEAKGDADRTSDWLRGRPPQRSVGRANQPPQQLAQPMIVPAARPAPKPAQPPGPAALPRSRPQPLPEDREWLTTQHLEDLRWTPAAIEALVPERINRHNQLLYNTAQLQAVIQEFGRVVASKDESARFRNRGVRERIQLLQRRSRGRAEGDAERVRKQLLLLRAEEAKERRNREIQEEKMRRRREFVDERPARRAREPLAESATPPVPAARPVSTVKPKKAPPVNYAYPPDLGPDPRTIKPESAKAPGTAAVISAPAAPAPLTHDELARRYRRLVVQVERRLADTRGKRRSAGDTPVRDPRARRAVFDRSKGFCENPRCAGQPEDVNDRGEALLQVDHVEQIADGGDDHPAQMIALCPNCHAIKTYGRTRHELTPLLRETARRAHSGLYGSTE
ncbi:HNH endonuclease (plasmid) [Streptomyces sp. NBC_00853]|uniref:HNH endonuclease n=1 Tax=Streptomyces sp. NBC_00853 TaxID=2903681 RepID=UPI002F9154B8|nr:HNH endonuclease [Streptomyces sp. NBC_00853]